MNFLWDNLFRGRSRADEMQKALNENILFKNLALRDLALVQSVVHYRKFQAGESVFHQGEHGIGMYIVVKGSIEIYLNDPLEYRQDKQNVFITQLGPGDFFGETALVEENSVRTASAVAREESDLIGFFQPDLKQIMDVRPEVGVQIILRLAEVLGRRLKETTNKVSELRKALRQIGSPPPLEKDNEITARSSPKT